MAEAQPEQFRFKREGPFAACSYSTMESVLEEYGHGNWRIATTAETLQFSPIREDAYHWTSTKNLWAIGGIIVYDDPEGKMPSEVEPLLKLHKEGNPAVRLVRYGFKTGAHTISDFIKNPFVIAQVGNNDLMERVAQRARSMNSETAYVLTRNLNYERFKQGLENAVVRPTGLDSYGTYGEALHIYTDLAEDNNGRIMGYMARIKN